MSDYKCPKCKAEYDAERKHLDGGEEECEECGFMFIVEIEYEPTYSTSCVEHEYVADKRSAFRVCKLCCRAEHKETT